MNIFRDFEARVAQALGRLAEGGKIPAGLDASRVVVEPPRDAAHGDLATNAAHGAGQGGADESARARRADRRRARASDPGVVTAEVAGPGFINLGSSPACTRRSLRAVAVARARPSAAASGRRRPVNVEYVSANPTGPMHVGHGRGAVFGDALAEPARLRRPRGDARVLHQRRRRPGRRARPLRLSCATARRWARRSADPRGALSGRLPEAGRRGARGAVSARLLGQAGGRMAAASCAMPRSTR